MDSNIVVAEIPVIVPIEDDSLMDVITFDEKKVGLTIANRCDTEPPPTPKVKPQVKAFEYKIPRRKSVRVFSERKLRMLLSPVLTSIDRHENAAPFQQPVDAEGLGLTNYNEIIKHPMDISTIRRKLDNGEYVEPWQFIEDVWLMLDNARRFNRKGSLVYRGAEIIGKVFEDNADVTMQKMGYCCGKRLFYTPPTLFCVAKRVCIIPRDTTYYSYGEQYIYCKKCFAAIGGEQVPLHNEQNEVTGHVKKDAFVLMRNDHLEPEPFVPCTKCGRIFHQICTMYLDAFWPEGYICQECCTQLSLSVQQPRLSADKLRVTFMSRFIENRVNNFLTRSGYVDTKVTIRVVSIRDRMASLKPLMQARHPDRTGFPYRAKAIFAFLQLEGHEIVFFGMHVQEYGSDCPPPNQRRVYLGYLDSVQYFRPRELRTSVYREVLLGYLKYVKERGFRTVHIWACPPGNDDDYIFHCHPPEQKIPQPGRLQEWYKNILRRGQEEGVVMEFKNLYKYVTEEGLNAVDDLPYFEGDFWPMILDDSLKDIDREEERKKEADESLTQPGAVPDSRLKKKPKKTFNKRMSHHVAKDLPTKMINVIKRHQDSFLVVVLNTNETLAALKLKETEDGDFLIYSDLMDGRDGLLSVAMERHYEFSSYRRAMFSTMLMLYELSYPNPEDQNVFMCSSCNLHFSKGFRCVECVNLDMCGTCQEIERHIHEMRPIETKKDTNVPEYEYLKYKVALVDGIIHAVKCVDNKCRFGPCVQFKMMRKHSDACQRKINEKCVQCRGLAQLLKGHAKYCTKVNCPVHLCAHFKLQCRKERVKSKFQHNRCLQRRMRMMLQQLSEPERENEIASENNSIIADQENQPMETD